MLTITCYRNRIITSKILASLEMTQFLDFWRQLSVEDILSRYGRFRLDLWEDGPLGFNQSTLKAEWFEKDLAEL